MGWVMLVLLLALIAFIAVYLKSFYASRNKRQAQAEENIERNDGKRVLEWSLPTVDGAVDEEFGELITEIPGKLGNSAKFYKLGCIIGSNRVSYMNIRDLLVEEDTSGKVDLIKNATRNSAKIWIYRKKGCTIGINGLTYHIDGQIAQAIKQGLGF